MGSDRPEVLIRGRARARPRRLPLPPAVLAILWLDGVLLVAGALALFGMPPALERGASAWTWLALAGSTLTAASAALSAFQLSERGRSRAWRWLPVPALVLWIGASGAGCFGAVDAWGATVSEAAQCFKFLLAISAPLLALMVYMLWRVAPRLPTQVLALGGLASVGAAAGLLALVHPHAPSLLDLGAHAIAVAIVLGASAAVARLRADPLFLN